MKKIIRKFCPLCNADLPPNHPLKTETKNLWAMMMGKMTSPRKARACRRNGMKNKKLSP